MIKRAVILLLIMLTGCPGKGREGAESGSRRAVYIDNSRLCFSVDKNEVLSRYVLSTNAQQYNELLSGDFAHLIYPETCFTVTLEAGISYGTSYTINGKHYYYTFIIDKAGNVLDLGRN
ncbi:putative T6SS immunity periplasmic lipoprotein [Siccibacter turicensis]|uniref:putative T6SS immunity periplasmic lipoprotein n=1 Tax=Siccibacter turicensis TaxID=357233 RepID=UPI002A6B84B3|nr:putative T6SS immunity periplasmic lipoprotein [Siccibacter turicensis]MDY0973060.1 hypothetical protein [Siccibacter turicensis]